MDFLTLFQVVIVSIVATSVMTLFSYVISASFGELYKEPVLLTYVLGKINLELSLKTKKKLAWLLHYIIGVIFVLIYHFLWIKAILSLSIANGFLLGTASGIIGIIGWLLIFKITDYKPKIDFKGYYLQLFFAHIIFTLVATATYWVSTTLYLILTAFLNK